MAGAAKGAAAVIAPARDGPLAVIDIGSNSVRLVVYRGPERGAVTLFNEKVLCGLGRGLTRGGRLNPEGVALARKNLVRFTRLARAMGARRIDMLATAAVREAADGPAFAAEVERLCGLPVTVLSGAEEGRLSALGVVAGFPGAHGVMGDLGGGSLELVELRHGRIGRSATLSLGPFQLMDLSGRGPDAMEREIDRRLTGADWLSEAAREPEAGALYAVGGAWRNLARIRIEQTDHPLHVVHGYTMRRGEVNDLARVIGRLSRRSLACIRGVTKQRLETLPAAALVLSRVVRALGCGQVVFSAFGLREGHAFDQLSPAEQAKDPLLAVCADLARREARFEHLGEPLAAWSAALFPDETPPARRLRQASCLLSDIAWREHPDYRAVQALFRILHFPFIGLGHAERVFLAYAAFVRYGGAAGAADAARYVRLLSPEVERRARVLGLAQRLAYRVSGATGAVLARCALDYDAAGALRLVLPGDGSAPGGEAVDRDLRALAEALGARCRVIEG
ncbi:MAG: Ppx/GppA family phosphatase [Kiloniellaceae bacterium]